MAIHMAIVIFLSLNPWPTITEVQPLPYTVSLMPLPITEPEIPKPLPPPPPKEEKTKPVEKPKPIVKPKKEDIVEKAKKAEEKKESLKSLEEALEDIRKRIALDDIQKRLAKKEQPEERPSPPVPTPPQPSPLKPSPEMLAIYSSIVKAKILEAWTIPENLLKEMVDLETVIVVIIDKDGKVQRQKFEKRSGNIIYDQSAMRAIKKAEPFPPIPKEIGENTLEYEMHFTPDMIR